jgi:hypothetical protein
MELLDQSEEACGTPAELVPELRGSLPEVRIQTAAQHPTVKAASSLPEVRLPEDDSTPEVEKGKKAEADGEKDFAAKQREISRNLLKSISSDKDVESVEDNESAKVCSIFVSVLLVCLSES